MENLELVPLVMRWLHLLAACLAIGVPLFMRYVLLPAMARTLEPETAARLRTALNGLWRRVVYALITVLIVTGLYTFIYVVMPTNLGPYAAAYQALFGLKMLLALGVFFIASALPGRTAAFAFMRRNVKAWLTALVLMLLVILMLANGLRTLRDQALAYQLAHAAAMPAGR